MFELVRKKFTGLSRVFIIGRFVGSLVSNSAGPIKCVFLNNHLCHLII